MNERGTNERERWRERGSEKDKRERERAIEKARGESEREREEIGMNKTETDQIMRMPNALL